ncbi:MAG: glycoside hydrolase family 3 N-terminal domain-containing protein [Usitatibacteraceae bacterium]
MAGQPAYAQAASKNIVATPVGKGGTSQLSDWPRITSAIKTDAKMESRIKALVEEMTLAQKIGQMTQPEIKSITPAQVKEFYIGSVLNGGGSRPGGNKYASVQDWRTLADQYYDASMATDAQARIPVIWGTDAVHGHNNVFGATVFPHNIGLGAAHDPRLIREIGSAVGRAVRATGINWVFAPTLAVTQDGRWGRTYESFSQDGALVQSYAAEYTRGLQGTFGDDGNVVATAKHFIGDGGTAQGTDQGVTNASLADMINVHGAGYYSALSAGAQTVMASFNSWNDTAAGIDYGKMHGSRIMLTDVLKTKMGFDGFVVSDWNGIGQVPGCSNAKCAQAINAGIDMVMVPDDWREFIANTIKQVQTGEIPIQRIDDAVTRILRVKMRSGLFSAPPSKGRYAGKPEAVQARALARRAVRESLVLLKNNRSVVPLEAGQKILVVGKGADSLQNQNGGWTLSWQGTENTNADFPNGDTILSGVRERAGANNVVFSETATGIDPKQFDVVIAVIAETPYAEGKGDIAPTDSLRHSSRYPEDLAVLRRVSGKGKPVVTVLLSGRTVYANDLLNLSDAFVAAWLPGTEGKGIADVLFRSASGRAGADFRGKLTFSWPARQCPFGLPGKAESSAPLFLPGYGLRYGSKAVVGTLPEDDTTGCVQPRSSQIFGGASREVAALYVANMSGEPFDAPVGKDLNVTLAMPAAAPVIRVETAEINTQHDAKKVTWYGPAKFFARAGEKLDLRSYASRDGVLKFDLVVAHPPASSASVFMTCGTDCGGAIDATAFFRSAAGKGRQVVQIPLSCFAAKGARLSGVDVPFGVSAEGAFSAAFANIEIVAEAGKSADLMACR